MTSIDSFIEDAQLVDLTNFVEGEQVDAMTTSKLNQGGIDGQSKNATLIRGGHMIEHETGPVVRPCQGEEVVAGVLTKKGFDQKNVQVWIDGVNVLKAKQAIIPAVNMKPCLAGISRNC